MAKNYLDYDGLLYFWQKLKTTFAKTGDVPTKTSQLTNDSGYITSASIPSATTTTPKMDGTASVGSETKWAKGDHVHPHDTTKVDKETGKGLSTNDFTDALKTKLEGIAEGAEVNVQSDWNATSGDAFIKNKPTIPSAGTGTDYPKMDGTKALGTNAGYARVDHVHPSDTSRVPTTRKVNGKALSEDIILIAEDIHYDNGADTVKDYLDKKAEIESVNTTAGTVDIGGYVHGDVSSHASVSIYSTGAIDTMLGQASTALNGKVDKVDGKGLSTNDYTTEEKEKLAGITTGANTILNVVEVTDPVEGWYINGTYDKDGTISSISWYDANCIDGFFANATSQMGTALNGKVDKTSVGQASGVCPLDANSKVDAQYLPSYVDDVIEAYARSGQTALSQNWLATGSASGAVITPEAGVIYVLMADSGDYSANTQFRWGGTTYIKLNDGGVSAITNAEIDTIVAS